jgi:hypothetical protein
MFESIKKTIPIEVTAEQPRKLVSMECESYTCLTTTNKNKERLKPQQAEVEKEELPYLDLDFSEENLVKAMVYSEIFGKPKSKRRKR